MTHNQNTNERMKRKRIKKKRARRRMRVTIAIILAFIAGYIFGTQKSDEPITKVYNKLSVSKEEQTQLQAAEDSTNDDIPQVVVSAPKDYSKSEVLQKLNSLTEDEKYETILNHLDEYSDALLKDLVNNPEMLSFVADYPKLSTDNKKGSITKKELAEKCPLFLQWDDRWGAKSYGDDSIIAVSGCGPTALSMVITGLTNNKEATPDKVADFAMNNGYYMNGTGTKWSLMTQGADHYGIDSQNIKIDKKRMEQSLDEGGFLICSMGSGDFTISGHFIVIYDYDENGFKINDPFCMYRSRQSWTYSQLQKQIKSMWVLKSEI